MQHREPSPTLQASSRTGSKFKNRYQPEPKNRYRPEPLIPLRPAVQRCGKRPGRRHHPQGLQSFY